MSRARVLNWVTTWRNSKQATQKCVAVRYLGCWQEKRGQKQCQGTTHFSAHFAHMYCSPALGASPGMNIEVPHPIRRQYCSSNSSPTRNGFPGRHQSIIPKIFSPKKGLENRQKPSKREGSRHRFVKRTGEKKVPQRKERGAEKGGRGLTYISPSALRPGNGRRRRGARSGPAGWLAGREDRWRIRKKVHCEVEIEERKAKHIGRTG